MDCESLRPSASSALAVIKAKEVKVLPFGQSSPLIKFLTFFMFCVKWVTVLMPHFSGSTFFLLLPTHLRTPPQVFGPLYRITAMFPLPLSVKESTNIFAATISASQPFFPKLPLPSRSMTTSRDLLQASGRSFLGVLQRNILHFLELQTL